MVRGGGDRKKQERVRGVRNWKKKGRVRGGGKLEEQRGGKGSEIGRTKRW